MTQVCPSPSLELEAAAAAFRKARQKFPSNARSACSGDAERYPLQVRPMIAGAKPSLSKSKRTDSNPPTDRSCVPNNRPRGNRASFPSMYSSRTASWSHDRGLGLEDFCGACGGRRDCSLQAPKELIISDVEDCIKEAVSKSTHSSVGTKRRRHPRHRRPCVHVGGKTPTEERICLLHGFPATRRRSSISRKPQDQRHRDYEKSSSTRGKVDHLKPDEEEKRDNKAYRTDDSSTLTDFPTKLHNWEHRTQRESRTRKENSRHDPVVTQKLDQTLNREAMCNSCIRETENSTRNGSKKSQKPPSDVCLRPSLIKAAQRRVDGLRSHQGFNLCGNASKHSNSRSVWDENLPIINHKDSVSILMDRFRGKEKNRLKLQNISELNSVLGSNQSFDDEESIDLNYPARKSSSGANPVRKLGRVANQGLRENESRMKNLRARFNRSGICCSSSGGTACQRAF